MTNYQKLNHSETPERSYAQINARVHRSFNPSFIYSSCPEEVGGHLKGRMSA